MYLFFVNNVFLISKGKKCIVEMFVILLKYRCYFIYLRLFWWVFCNGCGMFVILIEFVMWVKGYVYY